MCATMRDRMEAIKVLLKHGAQVNIKAEVSVFLLSVLMCYSFYVCVYGVMLRNAITTACCTSYLATTTIFMGTLLSFLY